MKNSTPLYSALFDRFRQDIDYGDLRLLKTLTWMVVALLSCQKINLTCWEPFVSSFAQQAQSYQRRWHRFLNNARVDVAPFYIPLVLKALREWNSPRLYLALDTTMLWNRFCIIHLSVIAAGRAVPLRWVVLEHPSATVAFEKVKPLLDQAEQDLKGFSDITLLADRGFPCESLAQWLLNHNWHWRLRLKSDTVFCTKTGRSREVGTCWPPVGEARCYHQVALWETEIQAGNLVLANPQGVQEPWAVLTDEAPTLETLWDYGLRFRTEELFLDDKSGCFQLESSRLRTAAALERLYLVVALALFYATCLGMTVCQSGLRRQVDPHWQRGLSLLKIGVRWLQGVVHKGRSLLELYPVNLDCSRAFASRKERQDYQEQIEFTRVVDVNRPPKPITV